jgi:hypothetical protein
MSIGLAEMFLRVGASLIYTKLLAASFALTGDSRLLRTGLTCNLDQT